MINIKLNQFSGPLELLLKMIEKEKMDITEISLSQVTDQYLDYIKSKEISPDEISDFLVVASRLILIKSRVLLPYLHPEEDEDTEEFTARLKMYKSFLEASAKLEAQIAQKKAMFARDSNIKNLKEVKFLPANIKPADLKQTFNIFLTNLKRQLKPKLEEQSLEKEIHIEDKILEIRKIIFNKIKINFKQILNKTKSKTEVVVSFLGLLELVKQRDVAVVQNGLFEDILIENSN